MFATIFCMYNFIHVTRASHAKLSQLGSALSFITTATENLPCTMAKNKRGIEGLTEDSHIGCSKRRTQNLASTMIGTACQSLVYGSSQTPWWYFYVTAMYYILCESKQETIRCNCKSLLAWLAVWQSWMRNRTHGQTQLDRLLCIQVCSDYRPG